MINLSVIIVNYNTFRDLEGCLVSIFQHEKADNFEVIVVDNNSINNFSEVLRIGNFNGKVRFILNPQNYGFSRACNIGYNNSNGDYILFLNPDIIFNYSIFDLVNSEYIKQFKNNLGILGINLIDELGNKQFTHSSFATPFSYFVRSTGLKTFFNVLGFQIGDLKHSNKSGFVDQIIGAFFYLSKKTFRDVGKFDELFFVYFEEMDFCLRSFKLGIRCYYFNDITVIHKGAVTSKNFRGFTLFLNLSSRLIYFRKHFSLFSFSIVWVSTMFIEPILRALQAILLFKLNDLKSLLLVYKNILFKTPFR